MKVYVIRDGHFTSSNAGPASRIVSYENFSSRYLHAFTDVVLIGRLFKKEDPQAKPVIGDGVTFLAIDGYKGPSGFIKNILSIAKIAISKTKPGNAYILRVPATIPLIFGLILYVKKINYAVEVVGDPFDAYSPSVLKTPLAKIYQIIFTKATKFIVKNSCAAAYVTEKTLQTHYPPKPDVNTFSYTSLDLGDEGFVDKSRAIEAPLEKITISHIGMMESNYKGHDILIEAIADLRKNGVDAKAELIGDGALKDHYKNYAKKHGVSDHIFFHGLVTSGKNVRNILDKSDIFVLPSRQEGLPRAMIEAMARALPCIGTRIGGIPELIPDNMIIPPENPIALSRKIQELQSNIFLYNKASHENLERSRSYNKSIVQGKRSAFYELVRELVS